MDNDMLPNDGAMYDWGSRPKGLIKEENKEKAMVKAGLPMLQDIIARFEERIKFFNSIEAVPDDLLTLPEEFMHQIAANKVTVRNLQAEKDYLEALIEQYR